MRLIPLTQGKYAMVDDADYEWLNQWKWHIRRDGNRIYAVRAHYVKGGKGKRIHVPMHRLIMDFPDSHVDHIDGNGLNNQRSNLRPCTQQENLMNSHSAQGNCKYKGVYWDKHLNKYRPRIRVNKKLISLGLYDCPRKAALVYDKAALNYFGEFARPNFENGRFVL